MASTILTLTSHNLSNTAAPSASCSCNAAALVRNASWSGSLCMRHVSLGHLAPVLLDLRAWPQCCHLQLHGCSTACKPSKRQLQVHMLAQRSQAREEFVISFAIARAFADSVFWSSRKAAAQTSSPDPPHAQQEGGARVMALRVSSSVPCAGTPPGESYGIAALFGP